jgi:YVTN family beta-propeller protein
MKRLIPILALLVFLSCKKEEVGPQCPSCVEEVVPSTSNILIGCEGNFGWGNASITLYDPSQNEVTQQLFQNVNGFAPGDVLQSFCQWEDKLYIILNNSGKIEVIDTASYAYQTTITGLNSPRYMVTKGTSGYVSDLYSNGISVLDLTSNQVVDTIDVGRWSEHLLIDGNLLYIGCPDTNWVLKYDLNAAVYSDTIVVSKSPSGIQQTSNGDIWILSSGGYNEALPQLDTYDGSSIIQTLTFGSISESPSQLQYNANSNRLFYLNNGVCVQSPGDANLTSSPVISTNGSIFYGLGIDPNNTDVYVTDAVDYVQQGQVFRFDSTYQPIDTFSTGIIPQAIWFK